MKSALLIGLGLFVSVNSAIAGNAIEGSWKLSGFKCTSGSPAKSISTEEVKLKTEGTLKIESAQIQIKFDNKGSFSDSYIEMLKIPKESAAQGFGCSVSLVGSYAINGSTIQTSSLWSTTACKPENTQTTVQESILPISFELAGDTLKITSEGINKFDSENACEANDKSITVFERVK